jgi:hypothetical protein
MLIYSYITSTQVEFVKMGNCVETRRLEGSKCLHTIPRFPNFHEC